MTRPPLLAAARLFRDLRKCNRQAIKKTGDINVSGLADCIEKALDDEIDRRGVMLAIAEFIGAALDGAPIDPTHWKPLERLRPRGKRAR